MFIVQYFIVVYRIICYRIVSNRIISYHVDMIFNLFLEEKEYIFSKFHIRDRDPKEPQIEGKYLIPINELFIHPINEKQLQNSLLYFLYNLFRGLFNAFHLL